MSQQQQQLLKILEDLLKQPDNKDCADCGTKAPRWASTNIGVFVCIRCSGIHRAMGTHISKVKSVSLDKWAPEQVETMQRVGNGKAKEIYEANVDGYNKGDIRSDNIALEQWIRDKYEHKRFMRREYDNRSNGRTHDDNRSNGRAYDDNRSNGRTHEQSHHQPSSSHSSHSSSQSSSQFQPRGSAAAPAPAPATTTRIRAPSGSNRSLPPVKTPSAGPAAVAPAPVAAKPPQNDLLNWDEPVAPPAPTTPTGGNNDLFGDFVTATPNGTAAAPAGPAPVDKSAIMSLFTTPMMPTGMHGGMMGGMHGGMMPGMMPGMHGGMMPGMMPGMMGQHPPYHGGNYTGVPGAMHPGMMGGNMGGNMGMMGMNPGMNPHSPGGMGMNPGMMGGNMMGSPGMSMNPGMSPGGMGMNPGMNGMNPGMNPGMMGGMGTYPMSGGLPNVYGLGVQPNGVPNKTF